MCRWTTKMQKTIQVERRLGIYLLLQKEDRKKKRCCCWMKVENWKQNSTILNGKTIYKTEIKNSINGPFEQFECVFLLKVQKTLNTVVVFGDNENTWSQNISSMMNEIGIELKATSST